MEIHLLWALPNYMAISVYSGHQSDYTQQERVMQHRPKSPFKCPGHHVYLHLSRRHAASCSHGTLPVGVKARSSRGVGGPS